MFRTEGSARSDRDNRLLAGFLALLAGTVNSAGIVLIGSYTSHATGNVSRFADELVAGRLGTAGIAAAMVAGFFVGAFTTSTMFESHVFTDRSKASSTLLAIEGALLLLFVVTLGSPRPLYVEGVLLCIAMGLQNALVTRLSGAVVRTTHLTGVVTDLGIEAARWLRYWRRHLLRPSTLEPASHRSAPKPHAPKAALLATILVAFLVGSVAGVWMALRIGRFALLPVIFALLGASVYSFRVPRPTDGPR